MPLQDSKGLRRRRPNDNLDGCRQPPSRFFFLLRERRKAVCSSSPQAAFASSPPPGKVSPAPRPVLISPFIKVGRPQHAPVHRLAVAGAPPLVEF